MTGKKIGNCIYIHRDYQDQLENVPEVDFNYDLVKYNYGTKAYTFIKCSTFNKLEEPIQEEYLLVKTNGEQKKYKAFKDPWIYHHKWMFVEDDYLGFDVKLSKKRSQEWKAVIKNVEDDKVMSKIGKLSYWENNVLPLLNNKHQ